ncbi:MAG: TRAP transporter substrate-binding protein [Alphaproteobacteria bacterium]|nr:TRAP transporter substrate-binding protein [Alphaproteobacteria bacterium]
MSHPVLSRVLGAAAILGVALSPTGPAAADAEVVWRQATEQPPDSLEGLGHQKFAELVKEYSGGRMEIQIFPSEQLGSKDAVIDQLAAGTIHIYNSTASYLQKWEPAIKFISAPFLFESRDHWARFMETDLVKGWIRTVEEKGGITLIGNYVSWPRGSYRVMVSQKPINSLADVQGLKLRMHPDKLAVAAWTNLGAEVRVLGWTDVYESLGRGIVEAVNSPAAMVEPMKFYEHAGYITRHEEYHQSVGYMANAEAYHGLPADLRDAVDRAHADSGAYEAQLLAENTQKSLDRVLAQGVQYSEALDRGPFIEAMARYYMAEAEAGQLPEGFLEAVEEARQ